MKYIILSPKESTEDRPCFWKADCAGYTYYPFNAGIYDEAEIKSSPDYYNNGHSSIAIPLTEQAMKKIGFTCTVDWKGAESFLQKTKG